MVVFFKYPFVKLSNKETYLITELHDPFTVGITEDWRQLSS